MTASGHKSLPTIGFLTVREFEEWGLIGAYLILNTLGRPLEFHCTAPVRANRAQEVLYGPTLKPFLYGEQIGQTLASKGKHQPLFICTDLEAVMAVREHIALPVLLVDTSAAEPALREGLRVDPPQCTPGPHTAKLRRFTVGGYQVAVHQRSPQDEEQVCRHWESLAVDSDQMDLREPFARLAEAIDETQRGVSRSP